MSNHYNKSVSALKQVRTVAKIRITTPLEIVEENKQKQWHAKEDYWLKFDRQNTNIKEVERLNKS